MKSIFSILFAIIIVGCASVGKPIDISTLQKFEEGVTTKEQVRSALGSPNSAGITSDGESYFMYVFTRTQIKGESLIPFVGPFIGGSTTDMQTLQMWFTDTGILKNYQFNETTQDVNSGFDMN